MGLVLGLIKPLLDAYDIPLPTMNEPIESVLRGFLTGLGIGAFLVIIIGMDEFLFASDDRVYGVIPISAWDSFPLLLIIGCLVGFTFSLIKVSFNSLRRT